MELTRELNEIIERRILPKPSLRKLLGFGRELMVLISNFPAKELIVILSNSDKFKKLLSDKIESSIAASFPKIELKKEENSTITLVIGDPNPDIAAEWK